MWISQYPCDLRFSGIIKFMITSAHITCVNIETAHTINNRLLYICYGYDPVICTGGVSQAINRSLVKSVEAKGFLKRWTTETQYRYVEYGIICLWIKCSIYLYDHITIIHTNKFKNTPRSKAFFSNAHLQIDDANWYLSCIQIYPFFCWSKQS